MINNLYLEFCINPYFTKSRIVKTKHTVTSFLLPLFLAFTLSSCNNAGSESQNTGQQAEMVPQDFDATFLGTYTYAGPDTLANSKCTGDLADWRAVVDCQGTSNVLGDLTVHFDFCGNQDGTYGNTYAFMVDQNSDTLFVSIEGKVIQGKTDQHPAFVVSYWQDPFEILGGTGKYKGATGTGTSNDYNSSEDRNSHHFWKGTIAIAKSE